DDICEEQAAASIEWAQDDRTQEDGDDFRTNGSHILLLCLLLAIVNVVFFGAHAHRDTDTQIRIRIQIQMHLHFWPTSKS
ncbi:GM23416, partial [Drosophila sechellia]